MISKKRFKRGIILTPDDTGVESVSGEIKVALTAQKLQVYLDGALRNIVSENQTATFTNKTFDANGTGNSISNLEVADLASGVLNTSTTLSGASDTQVPSALAVKTYVDDTSGAVATDVADLVTLSGVAVNSTTLGTFTGTIIPDSSDIKEAFQALETNLDAVNVDVADLITLSGVAANSTTLGTFTGTIIPDSSDNKEALQALETFSQSTQDDLDTLELTVADKVTGPASATNDRLVRWDGATGKLVQDSIVNLTDGGAMTGVVSLVSQSVTASDSLTHGGVVADTITSNGTVTGANATLVGGAYNFVRLTDSSLTSLDMISLPNNGQTITIENATGSSITINNDTGGTAANRILTGTKAALTLGDEASIVVKYDNTESRWMVIGGSGSGGGSSVDTLFTLIGTDVPSWSTGDNATFLGGGTISGTFAANTSTPLNGISSYSYTQAAGSLNDYLASPAQSVPLRFRGTTCTLVFPFLYDGATNDIEVLIYDVTNAALIPTSTFISGTGTDNTIFKTNVTIPTTCASIRVGFQVRVLNSGKIFQFDDVQMTADNTVYADLDNITEWTSYTSTTGLTGGTTTFPGKWRRVGSQMEVEVDAVFTSIFTGGSGTFTLPSGYTIDTSKFGVAPAGVVNTLGTVDLYDVTGEVHRGLVLYNNTTSVLIRHYRTFNGSQFVVADTNLSTTTPFTWANNDQIRLRFSAPITGWTPTNTNIVTAPDTFSTDTNQLTYAGSSTYILSTLANAPVGTFITFTYAINTNTRTQTNAAAPTQTTADMNTNGIQIFTRAYNAASTSGSPAAIAIQIGKGLKGVTNSIYKSAGKVTSGSLDLFVNGTADQQGLYFKEYNESTGILIIDAGYNRLTTITGNTFWFSDATTQTSGYLVVNASKNPALTGLNISAVAARGVNTAGTSFGNSLTVLPYDSAKTFDTHGALVAATGIYTAPESGYYQIDAAVNFASAAYTLNQVVRMSIFKNSSDYSLIAKFYANAAATLNIAIQGSDKVFLTKGDTVEIRVLNERGSTALTTAAGYNFFSIAKVSVG